MSLVIREVFTVQAPADHVFAFLCNPGEVVTCLPGAELTETIDDRNYAGRVKVKVGPISTAYAGKAVLTDVDSGARRVAITGEGKESGGTGSARMQLVAQATPTASGATEVAVDAAIDIAGRVMQFGRGLIESVSKQLFAQFVEAAKTRLESSAAAASVAATTTAAAAPTTPAASSPPVRELHVLPLLFRALVDWFKRLFGRW